MGLVEKSRPRTLLVLGLVMAAILGLLMIGALNIDEGTESDPAPSRSTTSEAEAPAASPDFEVEEVVAQVEARPGLFLAVGCEPVSLNQEGSPQAVLALAVRVEDGQSTTLLRQPLHDYSGCYCSGESAQDVVPETTALVISCLDGGTARTGDVAVVVAPADRTAPFIALHLSCGVTSAEIHDGVISIRSAAPKAGAIHPSPRHPPLDFTWQEQDLGVEPDRQVLVDHFCDVAHAPSGWGNPPDRVEDEAEIIETAIGPLHHIDETVFGTGEWDDPRSTCAQLSDAWHDNVYEESGEFHLDLDDQPEGQVGLSATPIADLIGLPPPDGHDDWYYSCM